MGIAFGPVPSRRLGRSLGINNIPAKICSYSCAYCQLGRTVGRQIHRSEFHRPEEVSSDVRRQIEAVRRTAEEIDYLTFVPDGEPTLDLHLGEAIDLLRPLGIPVAVITNASLLWLPETRMDLGRARWVSLKVDSTRAAVWRRINRPHPDLSHDRVLEGMIEFARGFRGELATETMLVSGLNTDDDHLEDVSEFLALLNPSISYVSIPTRPPAEPWVKAPDEETINRAVQILRRRNRKVEYLIGYEGDSFASTGDAEKDLLSITAVHPMREEAVRSLLGRTQAGQSLLERLIERGLLVETTYQGNRFYMRRVVAPETSGR